MRGKRDNEEKLKKMGENVEGKILVIGYRMGVTKCIDTKISFQNFPPKY